MSLLEKLTARIAADGPISVAEFMAEALMNPAHGYYATRDPLGQAGDFTTAPEISQMFGELVGLCLAQAWQDQGAPARFALAELGPGRGTLMRDALRATAQVPGFTPEIHLIEASPVLRARQTETLSGYDVQHLPTVDTLPELPLFVMANEFFDALPIRQFQRDGEAWREIRIGLGADGHLARGLGAPQRQPLLTRRHAETPNGEVVEICPAAPAIMECLTARIGTSGGAALVIDYGAWRSRGDTLQAVRDHRYSDPLAAPGEADLTAHVDFEALAEAAAPLRASPLTPQGVFLERLGITPRAQALARQLEGAALEAHIAAHRRLTHPDEMGNLFKVIGFTPADVPPLPGLA